MIVCLPEYVNGIVPKEQIRFIRPAIDPLTPQNLALPLSEAKDLLAGVGIDPTRPLMTQVARFDPWKDPLGVIESYRLVKKECPSLQLALVGVYGGPGRFGSPGGL